MGRTSRFAIVSTFTIATAVCVAGFFYSEAPASPRSVKTLDAGSVDTLVGPACVTADVDQAHCLKSFRQTESLPDPDSVGTLTFGSEGRAYRRDASLSVRVSDVFESLATIEKMVAEAKGTLETIDVNGSPSSHDGRIRLAVPSDRFTEVFGKLRQLGDVLAERITAQMVNGYGGARPSDVKDEAVEVVRVDLTLSDNPERVAKTKVGAVMGAALQKSLEHFAKGGAVLLEGAGYVLPFALSFGAILIVVGAFGLVARVFTRVANRKIPYAVPAE